MDRGADAFDLALARRTPCFDGLWAGHAIADHLGSQAALGLTDRIERAIECKAVEVIGDLNAARRISDAVELEERARREIGRGDVRDLLTGTVCDRHDVR